MSSQSTTLPLYFCYFGSNSAFFEVTYVHQCSKVDFLLLLTFVKSRAGIVSSFFLSLSTAAFIFHCLWHRDELVHQIVMRHRSKSFTCNVIFMVFGTAKIPLVVSWNQIQPYIVLEFFLDAIAGFATTFVMLDCLLHGMVGAIGLSSFLLAFLRISLYSSSSGSIK